MLCNDACGLYNYAVGLSNSQLERLAVEELKVENNLEFVCEAYGFICQSSVVTCRGDSPWPTCVTRGQVTT